MTHCINLYDELAYWVVGEATVDDAPAVDGHSKRDRPNRKDWGGFGRETASFVCRRLWRSILH